MKKTLLGVLAFVLVLATVLTGTVLAADDDTTTSGPKNMGVVKMVDENHPILVDGEMDEAYKDAVALPLTFTATDLTDMYTRGVARFVWSKAENALYCHVIMNDVDVAVPGEDPWESDSVEMFLDLTNTGTQNWGVAGLDGDGAFSRGLQYRIEGFKGIPTCHLEEDVVGAPGENGAQQARNATYFLDSELGRMVNNNGNRLINETRNIFGWNYSEDVTKIGWGYDLTPYGYMVEFRIDAAGQGITLHDGLTFRFDFQINDRYNVNDAGKGDSKRVYYASTYRQLSFEQGVVGENAILAGNPTAYHDTLTLSEEVVSNNFSAFSDAQLEAYGLEDATYPATEKVADTERTYTVKHQIATRTKRDYGNVTTTEKKPVSGGSNNNNNNNNNTPGGTGDNTGNGGCGGSIAVGTSIAMLALVGATGFFAFRRKDEE